MLNFVLGCSSPPPPIPWSCKWLTVLMKQSLFELFDPEFAWPHEFCSFWNDYLISNSVYIFINVIFIQIESKHWNVALDFVKGHSSDKAANHRPTNLHIVCHGIVIKVCKTHMMPLAGLKVTLGHPKPWPLVPSELALVPICDAAHHKIWMRTYKEKKKRC